MKDTGRNVAIAILLAALLIAGLMYTARAAGAQDVIPAKADVIPAKADVIPAKAGNHTIQCVMLTGCWYAPNDSAGTPIRNFWMWVPIYVSLHSHQYHAVWQPSDWRWIPEAAGHAP